MKTADQSFVARAWAAHARLKNGGAWETPTALMADLRKRHAAAVNHGGTRIQAEQRQEPHRK